MVSGEESTIYPDQFSSISTSVCEIHDDLIQHIHHLITRTEVPSGFIFQLHAIASNVACLSWASTKIVTSMSSALPDGERYDHRHPLSRLCFMYTGTTRWAH